MTQLFHINYDENTLTFTWNPILNWATSITFVYFEYTHPCTFSMYFGIFRSKFVPLFSVSVLFFFSWFILLKTVTPLIILKKHLHFLAQRKIPPKPLLENSVLFRVLSEFSARSKKFPIFPLFDFSDSSWCILVILCGKLYLSIILPWFRLDLKFTFFLYLVGVSAT